MAKFESETIERNVPQKLKITQMPGFRLIEGTIWPLDGEDKFGWGIRDIDYQELYDKYGTTDFLFEPWLTVEPELRLTGLTKAAYESYIHQPQIVFKGQVDTSIKKLAQKKLWDEIVTDNVTDDGYLYNIKGDPVYRSFSVELWEKDYDLCKIKTKLINKYAGQLISLKTDDINNGTIRIGSIAIQPIHYTSWDICGKKELVFNFYPKDYKQFKQIQTADLEDTLGTKEKILRILRIKEK